MLIDRYKSLFSHFQLPAIYAAQRKWRNNDFHIKVQIHLAAVAGTAFIVPIY